VTGEWSAFLSTAKSGRRKYRSVTLPASQAIFSANCSLSAISDIRPGLAGAAISH
jgi:hypothetical protein